MKSLSKSIRSLQLAAAALLLPATLASCQWMKEDFDDDIADSSAARYINISVSVSASSEAVTRAPLGGEYGDGYEKGFERENEVKNITLIFYQDDKGINTDADTKVIDVKTFSVRKLTDDDLPSTYGHTHKSTEPTGFSNDEVLYTTGDQPLNDDDVLKPGQKYHVIVVANANPQLNTVSTPAITKGMTVKEARDAVFTAVYEGTGVGIDAESFVMTSESDATVELKNPTVNEEENKFIYYLDCIHIERLAARIDFFAKTKNPSSTDYMKVEYTTQFDKNGYVYPVGSSGDFFVLTRIVPFNVMDGNEYMLKRTDDATDKYLADETTSNWVLDPYSAAGGGKNSTTAHPTYLKNTLTVVKALDETQFASASGVVQLSARQTAASGETEGSKFDVTDGGVTADNIILNYPKENTLNGGVSPLYYYATGLAFEGYYYKKDATTGGERRVFYHYLRHQGEQDAAYQALTNDKLDTGTKCPATPAMNYGIVRNNIYRVSIESITPDKTTEELYVKLLIKVKKWDKFVHTPIYM